VNTGFWTSKAEPLNVYQCFPEGSRDDLCPGGAPETCAACVITELRNTL
jgi:hypothetical protein